MEKLYLFLILFSLNIVTLPGISLSKYFQEEERPQVVYRRGALINAEIIKAAWYDDQRHWHCDPHSNAPISKRTDPETTRFRNLMSLGKIAAVVNSVITEAQVAEALRAEQQKWNFDPYTRSHDIKKNTLIEPRGKLLRCLVGIKD